MTTENHVDFASEQFTNDGPTGKFREVIEACAVDYGGNLIAGPGPVAKVAAKARKFRVPVRLVPTILGGECHSADTLIQLHVTE